MTTQLTTAIELLKSWVSKNEVHRERKYWKDGQEITEIEHLQFKVQAISPEQIEAIKTFTNHSLPDLYYHFLSEIGTGQFFIGEYLPSFEIYDLKELQEYNLLFQQEIEECDELVNDQFILIGVDAAMSDWMGFCTSKSDKKNFDVFCHEYPIDEYVETSDELNSWRTFEEWIIKAVETKGQETL